MNRLLLAFILILLFVGCEKPAPIDHVFQWPSSGNAEADSVLLGYERMRSKLGRDLSSSFFYRSLDSIAATEPDNKILQFRAAYLKSMDIPAFDHKRQQSVLDSAETLIDSAECPYDWHRLKILRSELVFDMSRRYEILAHCINYFRKMHMPYEEAMSLNAMGNVMYFLQDTVRALDYYRQAEKIYLKGGQERNVYIVRLNIALASPLDVRENIYGSLRNDPEVMKDDYIRERLLQNSFIYLDSVQFIDEAIVLAQKHNYIDQLPVMLSMKGDWLSRHGNPEEGLQYIKKGIELSSGNESSRRYHYLIYRHMAQAYRLLGDYEMSAAIFSKCINVRDSIDAEMNGPGITHLDTLSKIKIVEQSEQLRRYRLALWLGISIVALVAALLVTVFYIKKRNAERKYSDKVVEEEKRQTHQTLMAHTIVLEENERLISDITDQLNVLKDNRTIDATTADTVARMLRVHKGNENTRQSFLKLSSELDADFIARLKDAFPALSESQLKLASLLAAGLDSRQISNILNIEPASVYRGRSRLRIRLGLDADQSLEDFLRRFNRVPPRSD